MSKHRLFSGSENPMSPLNSSLSDSSEKNEDISINKSSGKHEMKRTKLDANYSRLSSKSCHPALIPNVITSEAGSHGTETANKNDDRPVVCSTPKTDKLNCAMSTSSEDFDSDIMEVDFFSKFNQKLPYSKEEDELILQYVLKGQNIFRVGSISLWKCLEAKKSNPKRTHQSLKNRFLRNIKPCLFTTYRHLIKNKETLDNILSKFPELKKQMGIKDTLSKIDLPARKLPPKVLENKAQAGQENVENIERTTPVGAVESNIVAETISQSDWERLQPSFCRNVYFGKKSIFVRITSTEQNQSEGSRSSLMKLSERFKKLRAIKERNFCPSCGRYNSNTRERDSSESDNDSDLMIPNSVESNVCPKNLRKKHYNSNLNNNQKSSPNIQSPECSRPNLSSQSLLSHDDEKLGPDKPANDAVEDNSILSDCSNYLSQQKDKIKSEDDVTEIDIEDKSLITISKTELDLGTDKKWDSDSEIDIIYESTVAGFRKLIDADEEKKLLRKCLYKNRDSLGFNSDSDKNLDSYFLDSSLEVETPTLTENYSTLPHNENGPTESSSSSPTSSQLASNMIKMLETGKGKNKKS